jgi:hypothetical protein
MAVFFGLPLCGIRRKWFFRVLPVLILLMLGSHAFATVELTEWTLIDPYRTWIYTNPTSESGRLDMVLGRSEVAPAWVVSDIEVPEVANISFTVEVQGRPDRRDDDFIGFCFGYQDNEHFYLLDWKRKTQEHDWGDSVAVNDDIAEEGIRLLKIDGSWTRDGLWGGTDGIGVSTLAGPEGDGWLFDHPYEFEIKMTNERIVVSLDGDEVFNLADSSFRGGTISLYAFSQDDVIFSNITVIPEPASFLLLGLGGLVLLRKRC